jgi:hypothetical protein
VFLLSIDLNEGNCQKLFSGLLPLLPRRAIRLRTLTICFVRNLCLKFGCVGPNGAPPPAPCRRQTFHPCLEGHWQRRPVRLALAVHLGASLRRWAGSGLVSLFISMPPLMRYIADNFLPADLDVHMLHRHRLFAAVAVLSQCFDLCCEGPR